MSLIMDALKKAQQMRLKGEGDKSFTQFPLKTEKNRKIKIYSLTFVILFITLAISFFLGYKVLPFFSSHQKNVFISQKKVPVIPFNLNNKEIMGFNKLDSIVQKKEPLITMKPLSNDKKEKKTIQKKDTPSLPESKKEETSPQRINEEETTVHTYFNSGVNFYRQREIAKAIQSYMKVIELNPNYFEAYNNLGIIYQDIGDFEKASELYQKAIEINPRYEKAYNNLGILYLITNRYDEALSAFQNAIEINPYNIESNINLGTLYRRKNELEKSIEYYKKALNINPLHCETHYNLGLVYEQLKDFDLAINHYQKFIQLSSKDYPDLVIKVKRRIEYLMSVRETKIK
jgi:Flp pilus assembly protein TadD